MVTLSFPTFVPTSQQFRRMEQFHCSTFFGDIANVKPMTEIELVRSMADSQGGQRRHHKFVQSNQQSEVQSQHLSPLSASTLPFHHGKPLSRCMISAKFVQYHRSRTVRLRIFY